MNTMTNFDFVLGAMFAVTFFGYIGYMLLKGRELSPTGIVVILMNVTLVVHSFLFAAAPFWPDAQAHLLSNWIYQTVFGCGGVCFGINLLRPQYKQANQDIDEPVESVKSVESA